MLKHCQAYTDWMKGLFRPIPDGAYALKAWGVDEKRNAVVAAAVFTHANRKRGTGSAYGKARRSGLHIRHGVGRRQDPAHDENLECGLVSAAIRLGMRAA